MESGVPGVIFPQNGGDCASEPNTAVKRASHTQPPGTGGAEYVVAGVQPDGAARLTLAHESASAVLAVTATISRAATPESTVRRTVRSSFPRSAGRPEVARRAVRRDGPHPGYSSSHGCEGGITKCAAHARRHVPDCRPKTRRCHGRRPLNRPSPSQTLGRPLVSATALRSRTASDLRPGRWVRRHWLRREVWHL